MTSLGESGANKAKCNQHSDSVSVDPSSGICHLAFIDCRLIHELGVL